MKLWKTQFGEFVENEFNCRAFSISIYHKVLRNKPDFHRKPWPTISNSAKDFVKKLLVKDPWARLTTAQALCNRVVTQTEILAYWN
uniref:Uncharacterized protein n=1 Tax=Quercus lobata TaxID=97700 RepID=A0A7N2LWS0_QUELO